jgi:hypothetical protein
MAQATHDLTIKTGEYHDRQSGETKGRWLKVGTVFRHDDGGTSIKLDCIPVGLPDWNGWISVFPREQQGEAAAPPSARARHNGNGQAQPRHAPAPAQASRFDDDVPF